MTTVTLARQAVRARIEAAGLGIALRWPNEDGEPLPDTPEPFVYTEFNTESAYPAGYGGGRGGNLYRTPSRVEAFVFVPRGTGLDAAEGYAEQIAALFRSWRSGDLSFFEATVYPGGDGAASTPPGLTSEAGNYFWAVCEASGHFDQVG